MINAALTVALLVAGATPDRLPPIDQCSSDASFRRFKAELVSVIERRDAGQMLQLVDEKVLVDLGGGIGKKAFIAAWKLNKSRQSALWSEIRTLLRLGCTKSEGGYLLPSMFEQIGSDLDPVDTYLAIVPGAPLRSAPRDDAAVVATLDWNVLKLEEALADGKWSSVSMRDGRRGYVRLDQIRNQLDYRLSIRKKRGKWRIQALVAGD